MGHLCKGGEGANKNNKIMDLGLENFLVDGLTNNETDVSAEDISVDESDIDLDFTEKDEFFHSVDEYGISEFYGCKKMLYKTVGDSGVKVSEITPSAISIVSSVVLSDWLWF